jgi:hypothetical protein
MRSPDGLDLIELGINHEEQHQELILTDVKHLLAQNPLAPALRPPLPAAVSRAAEPPRWIGHDGGLVDVGWDGKGFAFDNEGPRHRVWLDPFRIADRPVTCGEWLAFMADGGYATPSLWLSDGWVAVNTQGWRAPMHWRDAGDGDWRVFTLAGERPVDLAEPVAHVSHYEADAHARGCDRGQRQHGHGGRSAPHVPEPLRERTVNGMVHRRNAMGDDAATDQKHGRGARHRQSAHQPRADGAFTSHSQKCRPLHFLIPLPYPRFRSKVRGLVLDDARGSAVAERPHLLLL